MRIKLDLSDFLEDERKFSVLKVKPKETKTVRDVITKISQLFSVYGEECGQGKGWLLLLLTCYRLCLCLYKVEEGSTRSPSVSR